MQKAISSTAYLKYTYITLFDHHAWHPQYMNINIQEL